MGHLIQHRSLARTAAAAFLVHLAAARTITAGVVLVVLTSGEAHAQEGLSVFVPNGGSNTVTVHAIAANGTLGPGSTITGVTNPTGIAVRGDQAFIYVTSNTGDSVSVIDTRTNSVVQTQSTGAGPRGVALSPNGRLLYVANNTAGANSVSVYAVNGTTGLLTPVTTINTPTNTQPRFVQFSLDGSQAFILNQGTPGSPGFSVVDTASHTITATIATAGQMTASALSPDGRFLLASNTNGNLFLLNTSTNAVTTIATGSGALGVAYSSSGNFFYAAVTGLNRIQRLDASTNTLLGTTAFAGSSPLGMRVSIDGRFLHVVGNGNNIVRTFAIDPNTGNLTDLGSVGTGLAPLTVGMCSSGNALLASGGTFTVNSLAALGCITGGPSFTGGTMRLNAADLSFGSSMTLGAAGGSVDTNGQTGSITGVLSGTGRLTKLGTGTLVLSGNNTYSGGTTLDGGTLRLEHNNALGTGALTVLGSTIDYANAVTIGNAIDLQNDATLSVTSGLATQSGAIGGTFGVIKEGGGTLVLTGANSYRGGTTINAGTLIGNTSSLQGNITNRAALVFDQAFSGTYGGVLSGAGTIAKSGAGTLVLGGANTYTGATTIAAGTLMMGHAQALGSTSGLTIGANSTLDLNGFSKTFDRVDGTGTVALGGGRFTLDVSGSSTFAGTVGGAGTFVKAGGGTLTLTGAISLTGLTDVQSGTLRAGGANTFGSNSTLSVASGATVDLTGFSQTIGALEGTGAVALGSASLTTGVNGANTTFGGSISGSGSVIKVGTGTWTLAGNNQFTGATMVAEGTLRIGAGGALGSTSGVTVASAGTLDLNGFDHKFASLGGNGTVALGTAALALDAGDSSSFLNTSVTGAGRLIKNGKGVLTLTGTNTYTGGTTVQAGSVIGSTNSLQGTIVNQGVVAFDQASAGTFTGAISGSGALVVQGTGNLTMSGRNTYTGGTLVANGRLTGTTTSVQGAVAVDAALTFDQAFDGLFAGQLGGAGTIIKSGTGTLTLSGGHGFSGLTTVAGGTLALNGSLAGSINVQGGTLTGAGTIGGSVTVGTGAAAGVSSATVSDAPAPAAARASWATAAADAQSSLAALGQLTIAGDLTVGPQGTLQGIVTSGGQSTLLAVGGVARLNGATFDIATQGANQPRVMQTAVLDAAKGIAGQANARLSAPNLEAWLTASGTTLFVTVLNPAVPLASAAGSENGAAAATALDGMRASATGDLRDVTRELAALGDAQLASALDQVAGEIHGTTLQLSAIESEAAADLLRAEGASRRTPSQLALETGRTQAPASVNAWNPGRRFWGHLLGQRATLDAAGNVSAASGHTGGFAIGLDWTPAGSWMLGAGGGYGLGELTQAGGDTVDTTAPRAFGYAGYGRGRWTALAGGSVAWTSYQTQRAMAFTATLDPRFGGAPLFGGVDREAEADINGLDTSAWVDGEVTTRAAGWMVQPGMGVRFARYGRSAWTETGAGALSLSAADQAIISTQGDLRLRVVRGTGRFRPYGEATYRRELGDGLTATTLQFGPGSTSFDVYGLPLAENRVIGRLGASARTAGGSDVSFGYRGEAGGGQVRHAVDFAVRFQ